MPTYRFTKGSKVLTDEQRQFYEENGYIVIKNLVEHKLLDKCKDVFVDICNGKINKGHMTVMQDSSLKKTGAKGEFLINKIQDFLYNDDLFEYAKHQGVADVVEDIIGPNISAMHSMLINKPPDSTYETSIHPLHQDLHYFPFRPADNIVASWTAMEKIDEKNGCLFVVPGTHKLELYAHVQPEESKNYAYHGVQGMNHLPKVFVTMEKGDTVFFHPILLHGSGPNITKGFRKAISCHYADSNCYFIDVKGTTQEQLAKEIEALSKKRGFEVTFGQIWKTKSRKVRGGDGNFQNLMSHL